MKLVPLFSNGSPTRTATTTSKQQKPAKKAKDSGKKPGKGKGKPAAPVEPPKKRGRPSKQDIAEREDKKRKEEEVLRQSLADRQKDFIQTVATGSKVVKTAVVIDPDVVEETMQEIQNNSGSSSADILKRLMSDPTWVPPYPIFTVGQRVSTLSPSGVEYKGFIDHDPILSGFVRVRWDDGSVQYAAKGNLVVVQKKVVKSVYKNRTRKTT